MCSTQATGCSAHAQSWTTSANTAASAQDTYSETCVVSLQNRPACMRISRTEPCPTTPGSNINKNRHITVQMAECTCSCSCTRPRKIPRAPCVYRRTHDLLAPRQLHSSQHNKHGLKPRHTNPCTEWQVQVLVPCCLPTQACAGMQQQYQKLCQPTCMNRCLTSLRKSTQGQLKLAHSSTTKP